MTAHTPSTAELSPVPGSRRAGEVRRRGDELLSIGAVLTFLRDDFPEVTISKIRFLEAEGLVEPQRTPRATASSAPRTWTGWRTCCGCSGTTTCRCG